MTCGYSVIIPVYQVRAYIEKCLDSVVGQITQDVQVILIDDGSTDGSGEICDQYAQRYEQIEVIHQANRGVAAARNAGLDRAKGEYILWVDPDDHVSPDWFKWISSVVTGYRPDMIVFDSLRVFGDHAAAERYGRREGMIEKDRFCRDVACDLRMLSGFPNKVMKASLLKDVRIDVSLTVLEDYSAMFRILKDAQKIYYIKKILYYYNQREDSLLHGHSPEKSFQCVNIALERQKTLPQAYQQAGEVGVAVQAFMYCRSVAYGFEEYRASDEYRFCRRYIRERIFMLMFVADIPLVWKCKFLLVCLGVFESLMKALLKWRKK